MSLKLMSLALLAIVFALSYWACSTVVKRARNDETMRMVITVALAIQLTDNILDILNWLTA